MMTPENEKTYLENVKEFVEDEDKIVTYKWLSCQLGIHVNYAKKVLELYVKNANDTNPGSLLVVYLIIGSNDKGVHVTIVPEHHIENIKSELNTVITKHVYSIQKSTIAFNVNALCTVDKGNKPYIGAIKSKECIIKPNLRPIIDDKPSNSVSDNIINKNVTTEKNIKAKPTTAIAGMFANQQKKSESNSISEKNENKSSNSVTPTNKSNKKEQNKNNSHKGIGSFFSKNSSIKNGCINGSEKQNEKINVSSDVSMTKESPKKENDSNQCNSNLNTQKEDKINNSSKAKNKVSKKRPRKNDSKVISDNKRKRILQICDSDSSEDEIFAADSPQSPEVDIISEDEIVPPTPEVTSNTQPKSKKRKLVDKTYMDDEGFMVTEKEYVMESESEKEEPKEKETSSNNKQIISNDNMVKKDIMPKKDTTPKKNTKNIKKQKTPPKKQATLMSFFKKN